MLEGNSAEFLLENGAFEHWQPFSSKSVQYLYDEFLWNHFLSIDAGKKKLIKYIINELIEKTELTVLIKSYPALKKLIQQGRQKPNGILPLSVNSNKRIGVNLEIGQTCCLCRDMLRPFIASSAYILRKFENSYRVLFFTNVKKDRESKELTVNQFIFLTVQSNELGITPEQAVLQKY